MKKILFLFLVASLSLNSCSSDDDEGTSASEDPIIGTWILTGATSASSTIDPGACDEDSSVTFNKDKSGSGVFYLEFNNCAPLTSAGNWENAQNSNYIIELPAPFGRRQGKVDFEEPNEFHFTTDFNGVPITLNFVRQE